MSERSETNVGLTDLLDGILPCPFCGSDDIYFNTCRDLFVHGDSSPYQRLVCRKCGSGTTPYPPDALDKCVDLWNTRMPPNTEAKPSGEATSA